MTQPSDQPFESIESAYDFLRVLGSAVAEAKRDLERDIQRESSSESSRRLDAQRVACYSVEKLEFHITRSRRILNDLRSLRRLLFEERAASKIASPSEPGAISASAMPVVPAGLSSRRDGKKSSVVVAA